MTKENGGIAHYHNNLGFYELRSYECLNTSRPGCKATCDNHQCHGYHVKICQKGCYRNPAGQCVRLSQCDDRDDYTLRSNNDN